MSDKSITLAYPELYSKELEFAVVLDGVIRWGLNHATENDSSVERQLRDALERLKDE